MRQMTPNQQYSSMQPSQASLSDETLSATFHVIFFPDESVEPVFLFPPPLKLTACINQCPLFLIISILPISSLHIGPIFMNILVSLSPCAEHLPGIYHVRLPHWDAATPLSGGWYSPSIVWEPGLPGQPPGGQPGRGGLSEAEAQRLCSPAGTGLLTHHAEHTKVGRREELQRGGGVDNTLQ